MTFIILFSSITKAGYSVTLEQIAHEEAKERCEDYKIVGPFPTSIKFQNFYLGTYKWEKYRGKYRIEIQKDTSVSRFIIIVTPKDQNKNLVINIICPKKIIESKKAEENLTIEPFPIPEF